MAKKKLGEGEVSEVVLSEGELRADVSFSDEQIEALTAAGLEPAQVRNEIGLSCVKEGKGLSFEDAVARAVEKYKA